MEQVLLILCLLPLYQLSPVPSSPPHIRSNKNYCNLPKENGIWGNLEYLEDCSNISNFKYLPKPAPDHDLGVHPYVCCPKDSSSHVCFPDESLCPSHNGTVQKLNVTLVSQNFCPNTMDTCVNYKECEGVLNENVGSVAHVEVCGWDEGDKALKICCPVGSAQGRKNYKPYPRYSQKPEIPYYCDNKADYVSQGMCKKWRDNGACNIDRHFNLAKDSSENIVTSRDMFHFMMMSCMETCGRCSDNFCQDEHPLCRTWTKNNMCSLNPKFMGHTCRESCGVCGFLSPFDNTVQNIEGSVYSYREGKYCSNGQRKNCFDCGRGKTPGRKTGSSFENSCEATIISDKWAIAPAHCYPTTSSWILNSTVIRDDADSPFREHIEMKKVYRHSSIAVIELGRRIPFDFDKYGDTPACVNKGGNINSRIKCVIENSHRLKNNHDAIQKYCN